MKKGQKSSAASRLPENFRDGCAFKYLSWETFTSEAEESYAARQGFVGKPRLLGLGRRLLEDRAVADR